MSLERPLHLVASALNGCRAKTTANRRVTPRIRIGRGAYPSVRPPTSPREVETLLYPTWPRPAAILQARAVAAGSAPGRFPWDCCSRSGVVERQTSRYPQGEYALIRKGRVLLPLVEDRAASAASSSRPDADAAGLAAVWRGPRPAQLRPGAGSPRVAAKPAGHAEPRTTRPAAAIGRRPGGVDARPQAGAAPSRVTEQGPGAGQARTPARRAGPLPLPTTHGTFILDRWGQVRHSTPYARAAAAIGSGAGPYLRHRGRQGIRP